MYEKMKVEILMGCLWVYTCTRGSMAQWLVCQSFNHDFCQISKTLFRATIAFLNPHSTISTLFRTGWFLDWFKMWLLSTGCFQDWFKMWLLSTGCFQDWFKMWLLSTGCFQDWFKMWLLSTGCFQDWFKMWLLSTGWSQHWFKMWVYKAEHSSITVV